MQLLIIPALISVQSNIHLLQRLITHRANHSHLCSLHCRSVTTFDNLQHKAPHTTAVQFALINRKVPSAARCQDLSQAYQSTAKLKRMLSLTNESAVLFSYNERWKVYFQSATTALLHSPFRHLLCILPSQLLHS